MNTSPKATVHGFRRVRSLEGATEWRHRNGLTALIVERHDVPVAVVMVTYHVGSRHERLGNTGSTHILEHMMFKGSKKFDPKKKRGIGEVIEATGATINATTWNDRTNYYNIVETAHVDVALELEADRMRNLTLRPKDLAAEMVVVLNEYERGRNDPLRVLSSELWSIAFVNHPYHFDTIGIKEDIVSVTTDELREFYDTFYYPNNATVSVIGDIEDETTLKMIAKAFGGIRSRPLIESQIPVEPEQVGERRFIINRPGMVEAIAMGFKIPEARHKDAAALAVLGAHLGDGKGSVLYRELVDRGLATAVNVFVSRFHDPGLFEFSITLAGSSAHAGTEQKIREAVQRVQSGGIDDAELERARAIASTKALEGLSSLANLAHALNEAIAIGNWAEAFQFPSALEKVRESDVIAAANQYLVKDAVSVGYLIAADTHGAL